MSEKMRHALECAKIKLERYREYHPDTWIGAVLFEYEAVIRLIDDALDNDPEWKKDRALRLFLLLIDPDEPVEELPEYAECIESLLDQEVSDFLFQRMTSRGFPVRPDLHRIDEAAQTHPKTLELISKIFSYHSANYP